jgi:hypothetical protein
VSSLEHLLKGNRELFKGYWIDSSDYDWKPYPVIRLNMNEAKSEGPKETNYQLSKLVQQVAEDSVVEVEFDQPNIVLRSLIGRVYSKHGGNEKWLFSLMSMTRQ